MGTMRVPFSCLCDVFLSTAPEGFVGNIWIRPLRYSPARSLFVHPCAREPKRARDAASVQVWDPPAPRPTPTHP